LKPLPNINLPEGTILTIWEIDRMTEKEIIFKECIGFYTKDEIHNLPKEFPDNTYFRISNEEDLKLTGWF